MKMEVEELRRFEVKKAKRRRKKSSKDHEKIK